MILLFREASAKNHFHFLVCCYFLMGSRRNVNRGVFWETYIGFFKSPVSHLSLKYSESYINLNAKSTNSTAIENQKSF